MRTSIFIGISGQSQTSNRVCSCTVFVNMGQNISKDYGGVVRVTAASLVGAAAVYGVFLGDCDIRTTFASIPRGYFDGKVAWVTGASSGIGKALCEALAERKAHLIVSSRNATALDSLGEELKALGARSVTPVVVDLATGTEASETAAASALAAHRKLDFLFNNAGMSMRASAEELDMSFVHRMMALNFFAPIALARKCLPALKESNGAIINSSSISSTLHDPLRSTYCASKAGLDAYFDCLRYETGLKVISACPGPTLTDVSRNAMGPDGGTWGKMDDSIANGLPAARVAERTLAAVACGIEVSWVAAPRALNITRFSKYFPGTWHAISPWFAPSKVKPFQI